MPPIKLPDGNVIDFPDNPTQQDLGKLKLIQAKFANPVAAISGNVTRSSTTTATTGPEQMATMNNINASLSRIKDTAQQAALPTAGALLGSIAGPFGTAAGGVAGEAINQYTGISPRSNLNLAIQGAAPLLSKVPGAAKFASRFGYGLIPGRATEVLNEIAPKEAEALIQKMVPRVAASTLFQQAEQQGVQIPMTNTNATLNKVIPQLEKWFPESQALTQLKTIQKNVASGFLPPSELQKALEVAGKTVGRLEASEGSPFGASKQLFKAMVQDMDAPTGSPELSLARQAFKRSKAIDEVSDAISGATKTLRGQGDSVQFNANAVINNLAKNDFFQQAFKESERNEIYDLLKKLNAIPALKPVGAHGSGQYVKSFGRVAGTSLFAHGAYEGSVKEMAVGAGIAGASSAAETAQLIAQTMHFSEGRKLMANLLQQGGGSLSQKSLGVMAAFVRFRDQGGQPRQDRGDLGQAQP